jgi:pantoate--beta-alanine ligase
MSTSLSTNTKSPVLFTDLKAWFAQRRELKRRGLSIGFVPTMGALHEGHRSLLDRSRKENDVSILSVYVNPTQFDNAEDLQKYPATLEEDVRLAGKAGVDYVLAPTYPQIYPDHYRYRVSEDQFSRQLCGAHRPGHFDGVLTVVLKLLNLAQANRAYFGEKDFQQLKLVSGMVDAFFIDTQIIACPTVRESDGLAMSSRNTRLDPAARNLAAKFHQILRESVAPDDAKKDLADQGFDIDYIEDIDGRRFGAVKLEGVRLIDNVER